MLHHKSFHLFAQLNQLAVDIVLGSVNLVVVLQ